MDLSSGLSLLFNATLYALVALPLGMVLFYRNRVSEKLARDKKECVLLAAGLSVFLLLISLFFLRTDLMVNNDNYAFHYRLFAFVMAGLARFSEFPLWNPYLNNGLPSILTVNNWYLLLPTRVLNYVLALGFPQLPDSMLLYKLNLVANGIGITVFTHLLLREITSDRIAIRWATFTCLFSGMTLGTLNQEQLAASLFYVPLLLFLAVRLARRKKLTYAVIFGLFLGQSFCNHYPHLVLYPLAIFFVSFVLSYFPYVRAQRLDSRFWVKALLVIAVTTPLTAAIPVYDYLRYSQRVSSGYRENNLKMDYRYIEQSREQNSLNPLSLVTFAAPWYGLASAKTGNSLTDKAPFYVGSVGCLFFLIGLFFRFTRLKLFCLLSLVGILSFALGGYGFTYRLLYMLPFTNLQRIPLHMGIFLNIPILILSSLGVSECFAAARQRAPQLRWLMLVLIAVQALDLGFLLPYIAQKSTGTQSVPPEIRALARPELRPGSPKDSYWDFVGHNSKLLGFSDAKAEMARNPTLVTNTLLWATESGISPSPFPFETHYSSFNQLSLRMTAAGPGVLVWRMNPDPDWEVTVNGQRLGISRHSPTAMSVPVPAGEAIVHFQYRPLGAQLLFTANLGFLAVGLFLLLRELLR